MAHGFETSVVLEDGPFDVEAVPVTHALLKNPQVAVFQERQYARYMPNAKTVVGQFKEPMAFHNLAYRYADFIRKQGNADICLMPRKILYDNPKLFDVAEIDVERVLGYFYDRYVVESTEKGSDLLKYCDADRMRNRFNPLHHRGQSFAMMQCSSPVLMSRFNPKQTV